MRRSTRTNTAKRRCRPPRAFIALALCAAAVLCASRASAEDGTITVFYTCSLNGSIDYCHCKSNPNGGLVKRSTELKLLRARHPVSVTVETGDFLTVDPDPLLERYLLQAYGHMGYDAILAGDQELEAGPAGFHGRTASLPLLCNNLAVRSPNGELRFKRHVTVRKGAFTIGIIGTISPDAFRYYPKDLMDTIKVLDPVAETKKDIETLRDAKAWPIILLSHSGYDNDLALAKKLTGIDVLVGGHSQTLLTKPAVENGIIIVQAGAGGAHIGVLELNLRGGKIASHANSFRRPDEFQPADDPVIRKMIDSYRDEVRREQEKVRFGK